MASGSVNQLDSPYLPHPPYARYSPQSPHSPYLPHAAYPPVIGWTEMKRPREP